MNCPNRISLNIIIGMYYIGHLVKAVVVFQHRELKDLNNPDFIIRRIKRSFEGRCLQEYGFLIQVSPLRDMLIQVDSIKVQQDGCYAEVQFDCLCFKPQKGDIFDFYVTRTDKNMILGRVGAAEVMIAGSKLEGLEFNQFTGKFQVTLRNGNPVEIESGFLIRARCLEWASVEESGMKIVAETDMALMDSASKDF